MSIQEISSNFKQFLKGSDAIGAGMLIFVAVGSFLLGKSWDSSPEPQIIQREAALVVQATEPEEAVTSNDDEALPFAETNPQAQAAPSEGGYVASKNGTKYHLPWCSGAKRILDENKVWFKTKEEAEKAGYTPASNCKGI